MTRTAADTARRYHLLPAAAPAVPWREAIPRDTRSRLLLLALAVVVVGYAIAWGAAYRVMLFDPMVQNDDAQTSLFPFQRYAPDGNLAEDPVAREMLAFVPPAVVWVYAALTSTVGLFVASKVVQGVAIAIFFVAAWVLMRSPRGGIVAALLLVFLALHTVLLYKRGVAGGLPRAFAYPVLALWAAGAVAGHGRARWAAALLAAATYPSALLMVLAAEGLFTLRAGFDPRSRELREGLLQYAILVALCAGILAPFLVGGSRERDPIHTYEQAVQEPAFYRDGRLRVLPFPDPKTEFPRFFAVPLLPSGRSPIPGLTKLLPAGRSVLLIAAAVVGALGALVVARRSAFPVASLALLLGCIVLYGASRVLAFRLYSPERYYSFGMPMACILLNVEVIARLRRRDGATAEALRTGSGLALVVAMLALGTGFRPDDCGMTISRRDHAALYDFVESLPRDARISGHPLDVCGIPYWASRAHAGCFETLQPWFVNSWRRQKERTEASLRALYAEHPDDVLAYAHANGVTHLLLARERYGDDFRSSAHLFQPFDEFLDELLRDRALERLVLARPPDAAVVWRTESFSLVEVARLETAWKENGTR